MCEFTKIPRRKSRAPLDADSLDTLTGNGPEVNLGTTQKEIPDGIDERNDVDSTKATACRDVHVSNGTVLRTIMKHIVNYEANKKHFDSYVNNVTGARDCWGNIDRLQVIANSVMTASGRISSIARTPEVAAKLGAPNSYHVKGLAFDVSFDVGLCKSDYQERWLRNKKTSCASSAWLIALSCLNWTTYTLRHTSLVD